MKQERKQAILENLIYVIIWLLVLFVPVFRSNQQTTGIIEWTTVWNYWKTILPFLVLFIINNYILIPYFLNRKKTGLYFLLTSLLILLLFVVKPCDIVRKTTNPPSTTNVYDSKRGNVSSPQKREGSQSMERPYTRSRDFRERRVFNMPIDPSKMMEPIVAILIVGFSIAIRLLFKSMQDERRMKELEKYSLETELNYLKAQINPHFFMNTLNNIHALIDLDKDKARDTVIELSKLMRYVLYDASYEKVALEKEVNFLKNYVELMSIRYTKNISINFSVPEEIPNVKIAPMLFVVFVENAFKHGVSYQKESYITVSLLIADKKIIFRVENSVFKKKDEAAGVGLENVRKRLQLLYKDNYTLHVEDTADDYKVELIIPIES
ncbi:histidine kinase [Parabacteroides sp. OttesenSCG-928-G07]|nr:histidine kinase [Parabacteroides sp. OttesenSCG-928-G07]